MKQDDLKLIRDFRAELANPHENNFCSKKQSIFPVSYFIKNDALNKKELMMMTCELAIQHLQPLDIWDVAIGHLQPEEYNFANKLLQYVMDDVKNYARQNDPVFLFYLAQCFAWGCGGVQSDWEISQMIFEKSAELGDLRAQYWYASTVMMLSGRYKGVLDHETWEKALFFLRKSSSGGYLKAQLLLGEWELEGVEQDMEPVIDQNIRSGIRWLRKAAEQDVDAVWGIIDEFIKWTYEGDEEAEEYFPDLLG